MYEAVSREHYDMVKYLMHEIGVEPDQRILGNDWMKRYMLSMDGEAQGKASQECTD